MPSTAVPPVGQILARRPAAEDAAPATGSRNLSVRPAVAYQQVLHHLVRRELRLLADLAPWAPATDRERAAALTRHAELITRVLLHHHAVERESVWPAVLGAVPTAGRDVDDWTRRCTRIGRMLRDVGTAGRQWQVAGTAAARATFASGCRAVADAVEAQTADEERALLPLVGEHVAARDWAAIAASSHCRLSGREQLLVLGLALEDLCAADRTRLLDGLPWSARTAWWLYGARRYRAAVVRLRGAPPAD